MADPFIGELRLFAFTAIVPSGWLPCQGQTVAINGYQALYALLGVMYGGDGKTNFGLPDLRGRLPVGAVTYTPPPWNPGNQGASGGTETVPLTAATVPSHTHLLAADSGVANQKIPAGCLLASGGTASQLIYGAPANLVALNAATIGTQGSGTPRPNMQPYLTMQYCIATTGIFPPRQ